ncbi:unnamed protein product [Soboliphyme baturini]|uniref:DUF4201 domain-containing protein n=1 Tax=Soboliphyme baturini TaxID=241478 RepID=A0A183IVL4_9BILA|nr:unnamed protein product [Soboliphyme baturini]
MDPKTENFQMELEYMLTLDDMNLLLRNLMIRDELMSRNEENMNESVLKDEETKSVTFSKHIQEVEDHLREIRLSNARLTTELDSIRSEIIQVKSQLHETEQQLEENLAKEASLNRLISNLISEVERAKTNVLQTQKIFAEQENQLKLRRIEEMKTSAMVVQSRKELEQLKRSFKPKSICLEVEWKFFFGRVEYIQYNVLTTKSIVIDFNALAEKTAKSAKA